jgi:gliding motility-associated-like protein
MNRILLLVILSFPFVMPQAMAQPSNDDCQGLISLGEVPFCPIPDTFNNVNATLSSVFSNPNDNIPACFTGGVVDRDVWFSFTTPADGSIVDFTIELTGVNGPNGSISQPQIAVYRGDCLLDELQELACATSAPGESFVELDLPGLTPGIPYFIRASDWSASASPNWGDFVLCVKEYEPVFNMGEADFTAACAGTLFDSGGPANDYGNNENTTFTICPDDLYQCILVNVESFQLENDFDYLFFYAGDDTGAPLIGSVTGNGGGVQLQSAGTCLTILFDSDGSVTDPGFELTWQCSPDTCTIPPPSTCDNATPIPTLPYAASGLSTCYSVDNYSSSPCNNDTWLEGEDLVFAYQSPGSECIAVNITGASPATGIGIFDDCPDSANLCIGQAGGGAGETDPAINAAFLELPGTYYIVVDNPNACTTFDIQVQEVACPVVFPSAAFCEDALSLNGCGNLPAVISVAPGQGDPNFINDGINDGCWGAFPTNFTWFLFQAQANGEFGFIMEAANPNEASDIDFQVWGPVANPEDLCDYALLNQPIRSSYAAGADPTGMVNIHPETGVPVTDTCEMAGGDDFVSTVQVEEGEFYIVLINDWGNQIVSGAISIGFSSTTPGVLDEQEIAFGISPDTVVCPGETVQLQASGGEVYQWTPEADLSCVYCPSPTASVNQSQLYSVIINTVCVVDTLETYVGLLEVDAGPDVTACVGEEFQIQAGASFASISYQWQAPAGFLSCTDCPNPIITANAVGTYTLEVLATGPGCFASDFMTLNILPGTAPAYTINQDTGLCEGASLQLGGPSGPGVSHTWTSVPPGFTSNDSNPMVTPSANVTYYLEVSHADCPVPSFDSLHVTVSPLPVVELQNDTLICQDDPLQLGYTVPQPGVQYSWSPTTFLDNPLSANPVTTPAASVSYQLTADINGCVQVDSVLVNVTPISIGIDAPDTIPICRYTSVPLEAFAYPPSSLVTWTPGDGSLNQNTGGLVIASPSSSTLYTASISFGGCTKTDQVYIGVDSLPYDLDIMPADTQICAGEIVYLLSKTYEPADFSNISFQWSPPSGQLTPDSLFNMVVQPGSTTTYQRIAINGYCQDTTYATVKVLDLSSLVINPEAPVICAGEAVQLTATAPVSVEFEWSPQQGLSCIECPDPVASPASTTTYTVNATFEGCPLEGAAVVTVVPRPSIVAPDNLLCPGESTPLNLNPDPGLTYSWSSPDDPLFSSIDPAPVVSPAQTTSYAVTVSNPTCGAEVFDFILYVVQSPALAVSSDTIVCNSNPVSLLADSGFPGSYSWSTGDTTAAIQTPVLTEGVNSFTVTYSNSCGDELSETILVEMVTGIQITSLGYDSDTTTIYQGTTLTLNVETSSPAAAISWSNGSTTDSAQITPLLPAALTVSVTVTDEYGCIDTAALAFEVLPTVYGIPNVFTPNNDGLNDVFQVIINGENLEVLSIEVWSRWGQLVHRELNGNDGWDGSQNGKPAPSDVYIYKISVRQPDGKQVTISGDVTLLR